MESWRERTAENGGIIPDNVGQSGEIGEYADGKWYGGYYGWSWVGWHYIGIGPTVVAENAVLLESDPKYLEFLCSQLDVLIESGIDVSEDPSTIPSVSPTSTATPASLMTSATKNKIIRVNITTRLRKYITVRTIPNKPDIRPMSTLRRRRTP